MGSLLPEDKEEPEHRYRPQELRVLRKEMRLIAQSSVQVKLDREPTEYARTPAGMWSESLTGRQDEAWRSA